jgi:TolB protein
MRKSISTKVLVLLLLCGLSGSSQVIQVTTDAGNQMNPAIHKSVIVWEDDRNGNLDIYALTRGTGREFQVTTDGNNQYSPAAYNDIIVWTDERNGNQDIYGYNLSTDQEFQLTTDGTNQMDPVLYENTVVWADNRNGNYDIYGIDLRVLEEFSITTHESNQIHPDISSGIVVWQDYRNGNWDIYGYNLLTGQGFQITFDAQNQTDPALYADIVVWEDYRNGNSDIYGFNRLQNQEFPITTDASNQVAPDIHNNMVVWEDDRNGNYDIYGYDLLMSEEVTVVAAPGLQQNPALYEGYIVWEDTRNDNYDIYGYTASALAALTVLVTDVNGAPVFQAAVSVGPYTGVTDETGAAVITGISPGTYTITVSAAGYQETSKDVHVTGDESLTITLSQVEEDTSISFTVIVQDATGRAVAGASVVLTGPAGYTDTTDVQGIVVFSPVVEGTYVLTVSHADYGTYTDPTIQVTASTALTVMLNPDTGFIHGTVYWDTTKTPAQDIAVQVYDQGSGRLEKTVTTDDQGHFIAEVLKTRMYSVIVEDFAEQKQIGIIPSDSLDAGAVIIILDSQSSIKGVVEDDSGKALAGVQITVTAQDQFISSSTNTEGLFSAEVPPGTYTLEVTAPGYQRFTQLFIVSYKEVHDFGVLVLDQKPDVRIDIHEESPTDEEVTWPSGSSVMIPVLITLIVCIGVVLFVVVRAKNRSDLVTTAVISVFTGIIAIIVMWILFQIG